jgi:hypothetical protein
LRFRHAFIITYGRSGSTLLSGLINLIPGALLRGENHGTLAHLYRAVRAAERTLAQPRRPDDRTPTEPWFGASEVNPGRFKEALINSFICDVLAPPPGVELLGFKEIRYRLADFTEAEFIDFVAFLGEAFERPCVIFNVRRHRDVAKSAWWAEEPGAHAELAELDRRFRLAHERFPEMSAWIDYDRIVADPGSLHALYDFLGVPFDEAAVRQVLATPHSYHDEPAPPPSAWRSFKAVMRGSRSRKDAGPKPDESS